MFDLIITIVHQYMRIHTLDPENCIKNDHLIQLLVRVMMKQGDLIFGSDQRHLLAKAWKRIFFLTSEQNGMGLSLRFLLRKCVEKK